MVANLMGRARTTLLCIGVLVAAGPRPYNVMAQQPPKQHGFYWVLANASEASDSTVSGGLETHAMACIRVGLVASDHVAVFGNGVAWNKTTAAAVTDALGLPVPSRSGCCAASLWCGQGGCLTHHWGASAYTNYGWFHPGLRPIFTCRAPTYSELNVCVRDYSKLCPVGWKAQSNGFVCDAPSSYSGPCQQVAVLGMYDAGGKAAWATRCKVSWPEICKAKVKPRIDSVAKTAVTADHVRLHVSGLGLGDDESQILSRVGMHVCSAIEVCHTVCKPCSTDSECGTGWGGGVCLSVTGVSFKFCSVFCKSDYSCPCDSQCHEAYAGNNRRHYFCLNPNVRQMSDLCGAAYKKKMGHASGTTSFLCRSNRPKCVAPKAWSVSVATVGSSTAWFASSLLNSKEVTTECSTASDCNDGNPCTTEQCSASGCCQYRYSASCITEGEPLKTAVPALNYLARVNETLANPRPSALKGTYQYSVE